MTPPTRDEAEQALRLLAGPAARLREDQWTAIDALVRERRRALVVQRTGWGKSAVYFVATALLRARGSGPTVIVSPLLALMRNQVAAAARAGTRAVTVNSSNVDEWSTVYDAVQSGEVDVLLVSPERLNNPGFRDTVLPRLAETTGLLVVDEAHCISDWGHDFRPDYRRIRTLLGDLPPGTPVLATTATANARVVADVAEQLSDDTLVLRGALDRDSLHLAVARLPSPAHRLAWLADHLEALPGSGIVYTLTVAATEEVTAFLRSRGVTAAAYSGRTDDAERRQAEDDLLGNRIKALVATSALGMGFDKPDLGFVVHLGAPASPSPTTSRSAAPAAASTRPASSCCRGPRTRRSGATSPRSASRRRSRSARRWPRSARSRCRRPRSRPGSTCAAPGSRRCSRSSTSTARCAGCRAAGRPPGRRGPTTPTGTPGSRPTAPRSSRRCATTRPPTAAAWSSCGASSTTPTCPDPAAPPAAGATAAPACPWTRARPRSPSPPPRPPSGGPGSRSSRAGCGPPACPRWGSRCPAASPRTGRRSPGGRWAGCPTSAGGRGCGRCSPGPTARCRRTSSPPSSRCSRAGAGSSGRPAWSRCPAAPTRQLVGSLAARLSEVGRLPLQATLVRTRDAPRAGRSNSAQRLREVAGSLALPDGAALDGGPVLLVDDVVDSGWTLTEAARLLREAGAGPVLPLVLAVDG